MPLVGVGARTLCLVVALLAVPVGTASGQTLYVVSNGGVAPVDTRSGTVGPPAAVPGGTVDAVAVTPNGATAYVADRAVQSLVPIAVGGGQAGAPIAVGQVPVAVAITPDGSKAYVAGESGVTPVDLTRGIAAPLIPLSGLSAILPGAPAGIAITPNGRTVYVSGPGGGVVPIDTATNIPGAPIPITGPAGISIAPDGATAYVATSGESLDSGGTLVPISTATNLPGVAIELGAGATDQVAITPDGTRAYVTSTNGLVPVDLSTRTAGAVIPAFPAGQAHGFLAQLVISPDAARAYVANPCFEKVTGPCFGEVLTFDLATGAEGAALDGGLTPPQTPTALALVPAPEAAFADTTTGTTTQLDASGSENPGGTVSNYSWSFGDGTTATSSSPTISHVYSRPGTYTVTLTTTNVGGCANTFIFTGQTVSCTGSPIARLMRTISLPASPPHATITQPSSGAQVIAGELVRTTFSCTDGSNGPGLSKCIDSNRSPSPHGHLDTSRPGAHSYTATAISQDGEQATARITYTVLAATTHPLGIRTSRATIQHAHILLRLTCSPRWPQTDCRGTLSATVRTTRRSGGGHRVSTRILLYRVRYRVPRGSTRRLRVRIRHAALSRLTALPRHTRPARLSATIHNAHAISRTIILTTSP